MYFGLLSVQCSKGDSLPSTVSLIVTVPGDPPMQAALVTRTRQSMDIPWVAASKIRTLDIKTGAPATNKGSPLRDAGTLKCSRGRP